MPWIAGMKHIAGATPSRDSVPLWKRRRTRGRILRQAQHEAANSSIALTRCRMNFLILSLTKDAEVHLARIVKWELSPIPVAGLGT